jgi:small subunit ribosomal protein S29
VLDKLRLSQKHQLPIPVQSNISLTRFAELGANDPELAWPIWTALMKELTSPSEGDAAGKMEGKRRPPLLVTMDGVDHLMHNSAYLDADAQPVHAHDLALVRNLMQLLSGSKPLPNGGMVMAATSVSTRPLVPDFDHFLAFRDDQKHLPFLFSLRNQLREVATQATNDGMKPQDVDFGDLREEQAAKLPKDLLRAYDGLLEAVTTFRATGDYDKLVADLTAFPLTLPRWGPFVALDKRVEQTMAEERDTTEPNASGPEQGAWRLRVEVQRLAGLSKQEARGIMEYYARSGMIRQAVTEGLVRERWALAGGGVVGELERGVVGRGVL